MFRIDKLPKGCFVNGEGDQTILETPGGGKQQIPSPCHWYCGAAFLAKNFGVTVQRIYQLRDIKAIFPEDEKDQGEEVYNLREAIRDYAKFKIDEELILRDAILKEVGG